jgi:hypothetical protein
MWEKKKVLVTVKAYPEHSKSHKDVVCTAGITDDGEFIRLYPINTSLYFGKNKINKYDWIEVECEKATEKLNRKESYRVREGSIKVLDRSLASNNGRAPWEKRNEILLKHVSPSIKSLVDAFEKDRTSLGLIKVTELIDFFTSEELKPPSESQVVQKTLFDNSTIPIIDKIPHVFKYKFLCDGCLKPESCTKRGDHRILCEDWEVFAAYRKWWNEYSDIGVLWEKMHEKFYDFMKNRDLYFFMGTHSQQPSWLIIGLYYPPKCLSEKIEEKQAQSTFDNWI